MFGAFGNIIVALLVLGIIIVIHEAGHFLVAKLFKIRVETFSVGFGPRLLGFRYGETDYRLSALPLGGYVKMSGENPGDDVTGDPSEFMSKPKWQRFLVAFAGPAMNGILAVGLLAGLFMYGVEQPVPQEDTTVDIVEAGSPAERAGIQPGDRIVAFDGETDITWPDITLEILLSPEMELPVRLDRDGTLIETTLIPDRQGPREIGYAGMSPKPIGGVVVMAYRWEDSAAERGGLLIGDEIIGIDDTDLRAAPNQITEVLQAVPGDTATLTVLRDGETVELDVQPDVDEAGQRALGIQIATPRVQVKLGPIQAVTESVRWNATNAVMIFDILGRLIRRETSMRAMDGPIGIINETGRRFEQGFQELIQLMVIISLNLGVINLLPIPILDGGVMLLLVVEGVMRQDLSLAMKERIAQVSFVFLLTLFVFVIYNDVINLSNSISN
jgi:regulator of sigma E protease